MITLVFQALSSLIYFVSMAADDKCDGDKCLAGQLCVLTDNGHSYNCVNGNVLQRTTQLCLVLLARYHKATRA